jgi:DNA-binding transcriptional regulator GbsR (MarR family)
VKNPELEDLADQVGLFIEYWGFKHIHGRIWTHLYLSSEPLDTATLIKRLKVSKALMSFSIRDLLEYEVIQETSKGKHGTVFYRANPDLSGVILNVLRTRERRMLSRAHASFKLVKDLSMQDRLDLKLDLKKIKSMGELIESASSMLDLFITLKFDAFQKE